MKKSAKLTDMGISKKSKVLIIYPHPDDEAFCNGGLIQKLVKNSVDCFVLCLTKGEASTLKFTLTGEDSLPAVREQEFNSVMKALGVINFEITTFPDGGLKAEKEQVTNFLKTKIDKLKSDVLITYEPSGVYGHPDHIALSKVVTDLAQEMSLKLIYSTVPKTFKVSPSSLKMAEDPMQVKPLEPNFILKLSLGEFFKKLKTLGLYKSQFNPKQNLIQSLLFAPKLLNEYYNL